jgi:hypothetical protein
MAKKKPRTPPPPRRVQAPKTRTGSTGKGAKAAKGKPANEFGEATGDLYVSALMELALVLFLVIGGGIRAKGRKTLAASGCTQALPGSRGRRTTRRSIRARSRAELVPAHERPGLLPVGSGGDHTEPVPLTGDVHNLEHGGVIIQYGSRVSKDDIASIDAFWRKDPTMMLRAAEPRQEDRADRVDELGRVHVLQPEGVQGVPVGVPLPRSRVAGLPKSSLQPGM